MMHEAVFFLLRTFGITEASTARWLLTPWVSSRKLTTVIVRGLIKDPFREIPIRVIPCLHGVAD